MPANPELTAARDLVYQGVGRNVLQFQRLELLLKRLLAWHQSTYTAEAFEEDLTKRLEAQDKKTLGMLAGDLFTKVILKARPVGPADNAPPRTAFHSLWHHHLRSCDPRGVASPTQSLGRGAQSVGAYVPLELGPRHPRRLPGHPHRARRPARAHPDRVGERQTVP